MQSPVKSLSNSNKIPSHPPSVSGGSSMLEQEGGESIRVCIRIRPLNQRESSTGNSSCIDVQNPKNLLLKMKGGMRNYTFHHIFDVDAQQGEVFSETGVHSLLDSALEGYSCTAFAYGQTGSGKTYSMAGVEERFGRQDYTSDETDGIIPRAISYVWQRMASRQERYFVKSGFFEIYNEQVRDLLNPSSGVLHCRWNAKQGFFVEELMIVDCTNIDDLIAVLHEGMKNRKSGSHELNADSSRSHSILMIYFISEITSEDGHSFKRYGKMYFVDLAGSERLKETKSQGDMLNETKNINKSLFTLGKVISALGDKKNRGLKPHVPYRDSKLTMVLMDSLGGSSRAIMIACVSPANAYIEETTSTLNYATRAMNIQNKPLLQVDNSEYLILNLRREAQLLKLENEYLKEQLARAQGGLPPMMVDFANSYNESPNDPVLQEFHFEINKLREENAKLRETKEEAEKSYHQSMIDNQSMHIKLENLEYSFVGSTKTSENPSSGVSQEYTISTLLNENANLKKRMNALQEEQIQMQFKLGEATPAVPPQEEIQQLREYNEQMMKRVEALQARERELLDHLMKAQRGRTPKPK
ncbi:unnamed protein product [Blepharisma stoltei]|uniref:Kinesin-like protein n=1 Tax=Blepharisma stoltei TaxID=1481888 RepID=A0AAU9IHI1_9CILI|nr:unnamed protein product [Blepharisma stoltei]